MNLGSYSDEKADELIDATQFSSDPEALEEYDDYLAEDLPVLWMPNPVNRVSAYSSDISGDLPPAGPDAQHVPAGLVPRLIRSEGGPTARRRRPPSDPPSPPTHEGDARLMWQFILRRAGQALVVILLVTFLTFLLLHNLPGGGAARSALGGLDATQAQIDAYNQQMGYDRPFLIQYVMYLSRLASGDLGFSFQMNQPVADLILQRLPKTMLLSFLAAVVALAISIPLGGGAGRQARPLPPRLPRHRRRAVRLCDAAVLHGHADDRPVLPDDPDPPAAGPPRDSGSRTSSRTGPA